MHLRVSWHAALAVYLASFGLLVADSLGRTAGLPAVPVMVAPRIAFFALFWAIATHQGLSRLVALGFAAVGLASYWGILEVTMDWYYRLNLLAGDRTDLIVAGLGLAVLVAMLAMWGWRDGRWSGLLWVALAAGSATMVALYASGAEAVTQSGLYMLPPALTANWVGALRVVAAWLLTSVGFMLAMRRANGGRTAPAGESRSG